MNQTFLNAYDNLNVHNKRNELSNELLIIQEYLKHIELHLGYKNNKLNIKNYTIEEHEQKNESEMLTYFFEDIYKIEKELELIISLLQHKK